VGSAGVSPNLHLPPAPSHIPEKGHYVVLFDTGKVSRFAGGSSVKVYVASINKNSFKDLADVPLSMLCLPHSLCSEHGPDSPKGSNHSARMRRHARRSKPKGGALTTTFGHTRFMKVSTRDTVNPEFSATSEGKYKC